MDEKTNLPALNNPLPPPLKRLKFLAEDAGDRRYLKPISKSTVLMGRAEAEVLADLNQLYEETSGASPDQIRELLLPMEAVLPRQVQDMDGDRLRYAVYIDLLSDIPFLVLKAAVRAILLDPSITFFPSPAVIHDRCKAGIAANQRIRFGLLVMYAALQAPETDEPDETVVPVEKVRAFMATLRVGQDPKKSYPQDTPDHKRLREEVLAKRLASKPA